MAGGKQKNGKRARRTYTDEEKISWVADWQQSGHTVTAYAKVNGLTAASLKKWVDRFGGSTSSGSTSIVPHAGGEPSNDVESSYPPVRRVAGVGNGAEESGTVDTLVPISQLEVAEAEIERLKKLSRNLLKSLGEVVG